MAEPYGSSVLNFLKMLHTVPTEVAPVHIPTGSG